MMDPVDIIVKDSPYDEIITDPVEDRKKSKVHSLVLSILSFGLYVLFNYYSFKEVSTKLKNMEEISGGLRTPLKLPWSYPPLFENNKLTEEKLQKRCLEVVYTCSDFTEVAAPRRHGRLIVKEALTYFPANTIKLRLPSKLGTHLWQLHCGTLKPDKKFIKFLEDGLFETLPRLLECIEQIDAFILNECLINFNWLTEKIKQAALETVAIFLKRQLCLTHVILENALLNPQDGLRLLYIFGYRCGEQIEYLNIAYFFKYGFHPIKDLENDFTIYDSFIFSEEHEAISSKEEQQFYWKHAIIKPNYTIPEKDYSHLYKICLNLFSSLRTLHIQYSYLCEKQGRTLCQIASILNGTLENLYLLCTPKDLPTVTNQVITSQTWGVAVSTCPELKVHLIFSCVPYYDYIKTIVNPIIPLVSFYMDSSISHLDIEHLNSWYFGCTVKMLISFFSYQLIKGDQKIYFPRRVVSNILNYQLNFDNSRFSAAREKVLTIHIWHSNERVDVSICRCITHCYRLEQFEYRGPFDKLDTIEELCCFVTSNPLRLNTFHIYVLEDACHPELYQHTVGKLYEEYKGKFIAKDMNFLLKTTCI